jgi:asparagine synthase (glutamine-hydrolysing)
LDEHWRSKCFRNALLSSEVKSALDYNGSQPILEFWADHLPAVAGWSEFHQMLWVQSRTRMVDRINHSVDRMSMAHSVKARPPFFDHKLWEFFATIPDNLKLHGSRLNPTEKYLLREATQDLVPEAARLRKKKGLLVPYDLWLSQPRLPDWAEAGLSEAQLRRIGLFDPGAVLKLRREHQAGVPDRGTLLMSVLTIQAWVHMFLESPLTNGPPEV